MKKNAKPGVYKEKEVKFISGKVIVFLLLFIAIIIFLSIKACSNKTMEEELYSSAKLYFNKYSSLLPINEGENVFVTLDELISKEIIKSSGKYKTCNTEETKVKVYKLKDNKYHYTTIVSCGDKKNTKFDDYKEGNVSDLIDGNTDIKFLYLPLVNTNKIKNYYPKQTGIEYYDVSPNKDYIYKDLDGVTGYKWYTEDSGTNYWNNGEYTSVKPEGYDTKGEEGKPVTNISLSKPTEEDYREIKSTKLYRSKKIEIARILSYVCVDTKLNGNITSPVECEKRNSSTYKTTVGKYYTCNGTDKVVQNTVCSNQEWSNYTTNKCIKSATLDCEEVNGYIYTDKVWKWYISGDFRKYYPSGNTTSKEENTYYITAPKEGYIKDETTKATVYKYFSLSDKTQDEYSWIQISDNYLEINDLYKSYENYGFEVSKLNDIKTNKDTKYYTKMMIRNRK